MAYQLNFDGAGKASDRNCKYLTLACYAAVHETWVSFSKAWLAAIEPFKFLHTTDAVSGRDIFRGYGRDTIDPILRRCAELVRDYPSEIMGITCTFPLHECRELQPPIRKNALEASCFDTCMSRLALVLPDHESIELAFDVGESFKRAIDNLRRNRKLRRQYPLLDSVFKQLVAIDEVDMRYAPPIQAADLLGWTVNAHYAGRHEYDWLYDLMKASLQGGGPILRSAKDLVPDAAS